jgi:hypothetical protein
MAQGTISQRVRLLFASAATTAVVLSSIFLLSASSGESYAAPAQAAVAATAAR